MTFVQLLCLGLAFGIPFGRLVYSALMFAARGEQ